MTARSKRSEPAPAGGPAQTQSRQRARASPDRGGNKHLHQRLLQRVRNGDVKYACRLTRTRTLIVLDDSGSETAFIYSSRDKQIISFLPAASLMELRSKLDGTGDKR